MEIFSGIGFGIGIVVLCYLLGMPLKILKSLTSMTVN